MTANDQMEKELGVAAAGDVKEAMRRVDAAGGDKAIDSHKSFLTSSKSVSSTAIPEETRIIDQIYALSASDANSLDMTEKRIGALQKKNKDILDQVGALLEQYSKNAADIAMLETLSLHDHIAQKILTTGSIALVKGVTRTK